MLNEVTARKEFSGFLTESIHFKKDLLMIYVGIDVAKDKRDCCILGSDGEILFSPFTIQNTLQGFNALYEKI